MNNGGNLTITDAKVRNKLKIENWKLKNLLAPPSLFDLYQKLAAPFGAANYYEFLIMNS